MHTHVLHAVHRSARDGSCRRCPLLLLGLVAALLAPVVVVRPQVGQAAVAPLTAPTVITALRHAGLPITHLQRQSVGGDPSGPPPTERESWGFTLGHIAHGDARLLLFATTQRRDLKIAWYRRVGARILVHHTIILWLDRGLAAATVTRCRGALEKLG